MDLCISTTLDLFRDVYSNLDDEVQGLSNDELTWTPAPAASHSAAMISWMRGRLSGIELAQVAGAPELGNFEAGALASLTSVRTSIVSGGVLCVVGTVAVALAIPALIRYDARRPQQE